jgi:hypothetical protein
MFALQLTVNVKYLCVYSIGFKQHNHNLLKQLLNSEGLSQSWVDIVVPLAQQIVDTVRPDVRNDADDMDIRQ